MAKDKEEKRKGTGDTDLDKMLDGAMEEIKKEWQSWEAAVEKANASTIDSIKLGRAAFTQASDPGSEFDVSDAFRYSAASLAMGFNTWRSIVAGFWGPPMAPGSGDSSSGSGDTTTKSAK